MWELEIRTSQISLDIGGGSTWFAPEMLAACRLSERMASMWHDKAKGAVVGLGYCAAWLANASWVKSAGASSRAGSPPTDATMGTALNAAAKGCWGL